jgi:predicted GNAT superfamily acetyltransferase
MIVRALSTLAECREVAALERQIWDYKDGEDVLPPAVLVVTIMRGGVLLGAFDETSTMKGYAYAAPAMKDGRPTLWSHALGVVPDGRGMGLGVALKLAQRQHALRSGIDLIEWTADPLSATSAHLNFNKLGVLVEGYEEDLYGESGSALHGGAPTDRFMVEWHLSTPHVERRIGASTRANGATRRPRGTAAPISVRDSAVVAAVLVNPSRGTIGSREPGDADLDVEAARVLVEMPTNFTELLHNHPDLAREWRKRTRDIFQSYFGRGYRAVDFFLAREQGRGQYLLARAAS